MNEPIRLLIVDDNAAKSSAVGDLAEESLPAGGVVVSRVGTLTDAGRHLERNHVDLMVLDVVVPQREGEEPRELGGVQFLRGLSQTRKHRLPRYIVGLTEFEDAQSSCREYFSEQNWYLLLYSEGKLDWRDRLTKMLLHIFDSSRVGPSAYKTDLAILTALEHTELEAVLKLPADWKRVKVEGDPTIYHAGIFRRNNVSLSVVAAAAIEMGMAASTAMAMKLIYEFRPKHLAMVGIAGGVEGQMGDVLVADMSFDYGSGKVKEGSDAAKKFLPDPHPLPLQSAMRAKLSYFNTRTEVLDAIRRNASGTKLPDRLNVRMGPIGSGAAVVQHRGVVEEVQQLWRKLIGVEMETYGVFMAGNLCSDPKPSIMSIKSICDFANADKGDDYQVYAAYTSSRYIYEFALEMLGDPMI